MKYLERAYPWLLLSPVILPVVIWSGLIYPYLVPKTLLFYALSLVALGTFILLVAYGRSFSWARLGQWEARVPIALLALAYVASALGVDFYRSFWSIFVRGDGLLMLTFAVADFYLILLYADRAFFERLLRAVAVVASAVALYGIGEWALGGGRIGSLLGNAAFFAGYLGIAFFATLAAARRLSLLWRRALYLGAGAQLIAIVLSATRGTMLALALTGLVTLVYVAFRRPRPLPSPAESKNGALRAARPSLTPFFNSAGSGRTLSRVILFALVVAAGLFFAFRSELARVPFAPIARIASIGVNDPDVASRLFTWRNMLGQIERAPLLGVGAEHIDVPFNRFYDPTQIQEQWFDRSHNAFLDYAVQYGIGGLLLYLALIGSFFGAARRLSEHGERNSAGLFVLLALTYAAQNFFIFDTVSSFWLLLALLAAFLALSFEEVPRIQYLPPPRMKLVSWVVALACVLAIIPVSLRPALAAYDLAHAYLYQLVDVPKETSYLSGGFALGTYADLEYGYEGYDIYTGTQATKLSGAPREAGYQATTAILTRNFNRYPYDARTALYLAHVLSLAPPGISVDQKLLSAALERTIRLSPKRLQSWYILVNLSLSQANTHAAGSPERAAGYAAARNLLTRYIALVPTLAEPHFVLAELYRAEGDAADASAEAALGEADYTSDLQTARRAAGYYEEMKNWKDAAYFLGEVTKLAPADDASRYDLAKVLYLAGNPAAAESIVAVLRIHNPAILETDQNFLAAITAYEQFTK